MTEQQKINGFKASSAKPRYAELLPSDGQIYVGLDIGSTSSDVVILNKRSDVLFSDYQRTSGRPIETLRAQLSKIFEIINPSDIVFTAATGSAGRFIADLLDITFVNEIPAQAAAVNHLYPHLKQATIVEMGGQDSKLIFLSSENGRACVRDFELNTVCAAGTGSFLDQQAQRLGVDIEDQFGQMALQCKNAPRMAGRCSVFAKSDMIHLQQQATPTGDIIAGLCLALARNLKSNLGCGRDFIKPIIFTGGVAANIGVAKAIEQVFELARTELIIPKQHFFTGAIGAVLVSKTRRTTNINGQLNPGKIDNYLSKRGHALKNAARREPLSQPAFPPPQSNVYEELLADAAEPLDAYLGVDVGSISTNVVVINERKQVLAKAYLMTAGKPLEAVREGLDIVGKKVAGKVKIKGAATTGSGRYLTGDFIGADLVINEITAQAAGAAIVNPEVDTIFEIGGQDSKYISLENGVVVDFEMNHACAAGTGSFLEEQAQRLGININQEFAKLAFKSDCPIKLGERCTVFIESDLLSYQQQGAQTQELVAGLSYSIVANYLNRVVGRRKIGNNICFQGGTAFNKAVWAAFENVTGKKIMVPDHHEVTGAIGAASIIAERIKIMSQEGETETASGFKGFDDLAAIKYSVESFTCEHCSNNCEIKEVKISGSEPLFYGSRCDRYNLKKNKINKPGMDAFEYRKKKLLEFAELLPARANLNTTKTKIGLPRALINYQLLPLFSIFFKSLGFEVVLSPQTNKKIIREGVELVTAQPCFPVKVAYGHIAELIKEGVDYIFIPSIVSMTASFPENKHNQLCPYVQSFAYQAKTAFADKLGETKILTVPIRLGEGKKLIRKSFLKLGKKIGVDKLSVIRAVEKAFSAQDKFDRALIEKGKEILDDIKPGERLFVLISRPYNGCDEGLNLQLPKKLNHLNARVIPMDMLDLSRARLTDKSLHTNIYWTYGQKILRAAEIIKDSPNLFAIYLSNFSCGPDSFLLTFFKDIMSPKPCLQLELDEHSADAGVITRLEAFLDSLKHYQSRPKTSALKHRAQKSLSKRKIHIPYMGDCAYGIAACLRAYGQQACVIPIADESALLLGRRLTTGKECLPCAITAGDMLKIINAKDFEPENTAFFMPTASGPCRFGMYNCLHKLILEYIKVDNVPIVSPNQDSNFYTELVKMLKISSASKFMIDIWTATVGVDLLHKLLLRLRPFSKDVSQAQRIYDKSLERWTEAVEQRTTFRDKLKLMRSICSNFETIELDHIIKKPRIGIVGEIYVRSHPFANSNIIARLEKLGAACDLAPLAEWIYYTNFARKNMAGRRGQVKNLLVNLILSRCQHIIERKLAKPLEEKFGRLAENEIEDVINLAEEYLHRSLEGEAILSIGKTVEYYHQGFGGVVNVMPFSCMPSTVVSSHTMRLSRDCDYMPILNLSFDGQEDSTLTTRLEAFVEQVRQKQSRLLSVSDFLSAPAGIGQNTPRRDEKLLPESTA